jgi:hypothetical protein
MVTEDRTAAAIREVEQQEQVPEAREEFTSLQRERVIRGAISTQAMEGIEVPRDMAEAAFESAMRKPLPRLS